MSVLLRRVLLGKPLPTAHAIHTRLPKRLALAVFSSDALSSTAYATEEILRILMLYSAAGIAAGGPALGLVWPIALAIAVLLFIVSLSYRQTIFAYPGGASAYLVSKDNLGTNASLIAGASLLTDYILTVAVSVSAGVAAVVSAFPALHSYIVPLCLLSIGFVMLANLRGAKESGGVFAIPTYSFIFSMLLMTVLGVIKAATGNVVAPAHALSTAEATRLALEEHGQNALLPVTLFAILRAFTSGCTALTGIEAISDGVPAFKKPEPNNAATTLMVMVVVLITMFLGMSYLANAFHLSAIPENVKGYETVISQIGRRVFTGPFAWYYYVLMTASAAILVVAANTAYQDFPRLASLLARDRFLPSQLANLGDRLVFQNGIIALTVFAGILVVLFGGSVTSLLPLYAVGVFTSFTLSQSSMVRKWLNERGPNWQGKVALNLFGAICTGVVLVVIAITKFNAGDPTGLKVGGVSINWGAWVVIALVPCLVLTFKKIRSHYNDVARLLVADHVPELLQEQRRATIHHTVLVLIPGIHRGVFPALLYGRSLSDDARAVYIETDPERTPILKEAWERHISGVPLIVIESPFRELRAPLLEYVDEVQKERDDDIVTVVLPELVTVTKWWHRLLHNTSGNALRRALGRREGVIVTSFRYFASDHEADAFRRLAEAEEQQEAAESREQTRDQTGAKR